ncbi:MAG: hypothetical protein GY943_29710 [Chloroflexi bacterium]|nr:hypothetical protein [Chloroflexota bacterium]
MKLSRQNRSWVLLATGEENVVWHQKRKYQLSQIREKANIHMKWKKGIVIIVLVFGVFWAMAYGLTATLVGEKESNPQVVELHSPQLQEKNTLILMTQNIAHGRKDGANQILQSSLSIEANLNEIAPFFHRINTDVIALQEADAPSIWSGSFDHVQYLAKNAQYPFYVHGKHVKSSWLAYGTAILSKYPIIETLSVTFSPTPPTPAKGFLVTQMEWPDSSGRVVDIVSVHLDFSRSNVRNEQAEEIIQVLAKRENPIIVMGDFNSDWETENSPIRRLVQELDLKAYDPEAKDLITFDAINSRFDWILISKELEFKTYEVLSDIVSDHSAVVSEIVFLEDTKTP